MNMPTSIESLTSVIISDILESKELSCSRILMIARQVYQDRHR